MRVIFAGTPEFAVPSLRSLIADGHEVVGVITRDDAPVGRKRVLTPSPVADVAAELGLPIWKTNRLDEAAADWVAGLAPDLGVIVAYGGLVRDPLLSMPALGWINLHFSDLPRWRGAAPVQRALMAGELRLGVSVFRLVEALDAGAVLSRAWLEIPQGTDAGTALARLAEFGTEALGRAIRELAIDPVAGEPQQGEATYAHKLTRDDGKLDMTLDRACVLAHWAGVTPEPGAWAQLGDHPVKIIDLAWADTASETHDAARLRGTPAVPGTVTLDATQVLLHLSDGPLEVRSVQPSGKPSMPASDWLRGRGGTVVLR